MKRKKSLLKKVTIIIFVVVGVVSLVLIYKSVNSPKLYLKDGVLAISNYISSKSNLKLEELQGENESLNIYMAENIALKEEIEQLKEEMKIKTILSDKEIVYASVINRDLDYWRDSLVIDKGENDGVVNDMAVVSKGALVGITNNVSHHTSSVALLKSSKFPIKLSVKVKLDDQYVYGILDNYKDDFFEIIGIVENINIPKDSLVITSGLSDNIPGGIMIGYVEDVITDNFDLSKVIRVKSAIDFDDINYVSVVKR